MAARMVASPATTAAPLQVSPQAIVGIHSHSPTTTAGTRSHNTTAIEATRNRNTTTTAEILLSRLITVTVVIPHRGPTILLHHEDILHRSKVRRAATRHRVLILHPVILRRGVSVPPLEAIAAVAAVTTAADREAATAVEVGRHVAAATAAVEDPIPAAVRWAADLTAAPAEAGDMQAAAVAADTVADIAKS